MESIPLRETVLGRRLAPRCMSRRSPSLIRPARLFRNMKTIHKLLLILVVLGALSLEASAQSNASYINNENRDNIPTDKAVARLSFPTEFKLFNLDIEPSRQQLFSIVDSNVPPRSTVIVLPNANGQYEQFEVFEASDFEPAFTGPMPEIGLIRQGHYRQACNSQVEYFSAGNSDHGLQNGDQTMNSVNPIPRTIRSMPVFRSQRARGRLPWTCSTEDKQIAAALDSQLPEQTRLKVIQDN